MDFKFVSHELWSEKQNIFLRHMHNNEFWILPHKCGNNLKHENEADSLWPFMFKIITTLVGKNTKFFYACVNEGCSASPTIAYEKQT